MTSVPGSEPRSGALARLGTPGARRWYIGAGFGLAYQGIEIGSIWLFGSATVGERIGATAALLALYAIFFVLPPLVWPERGAVRLGAVLGFWALSCALFPIVGETTIWTWVTVAVLIGFTRLPRVVAAVLIVGVVGAQVAIAAATGWSDSTSFAPYITLSVGVSMIAYGQLIERNAQLRRAHEEVARLAVAEERARLARDLHDSLGHSLTVVTVKSELARKLVSRDPAGAEAEIADIERLAREGLADLRTAVAGYRDVDLEAELASARTSLAAAGITAHLPDDGRIVRRELRPLFGWVVREGVTNVIRHSGARACWVDLGPRRIVVRDDGVVTGSAIAAAGPGNGLRNLRERAEAVGGRVASGPRPGGGYTLEVAA